MTFIKYIIDKIFGLFPKANINIDVISKSERIEHVFRFETNRLQVCIGHIETQRKWWPFSDGKYFVHPLGDGKLESVNLCDTKAIKQLKKKQQPLIETTDAKD